MSYIPIYVIAESIIIVKVVFYLSCVVKEIKHKILNMRNKKHKCKV